MGEDLNLIDTYAMVRTNLILVFIHISPHSLFEYDYENFRGKYPEEDQSNILVGFDLDLPFSFVYIFQLFFRKATLSQLKKSIQLKSLKKFEMMK
jgi:hypothetical protein